MIHCYPPKRTALAALVLAASLPATAQPLEEIVVTASLRDTPLLDQAASTSVVSAQTVRERAANHLEDILHAIPNLNFAGGTSRARFFQVRGIGERSQYQEPLNASVGLLMDGVDFSGLGTAGTLFDIEQVEVLRGPQGTLHGANALAGLISIRSAAPEAEPGLRLEAGVGNYDSHTLGLAGTGPLVQDRLLYRIAVHQHQSDGFYQNDFLDRDDTNNRDERGARLRLRWLAGDADTLDLTLLHTDIDNGFDAFSLDNNRRTLSDQPGRDRQQSTALSLHWQAERDNVTLESRLSVARSDTEYSFDEDWSFVGIAPELEYSSFDRYLRDRDSVSAELRLLSNDSSRLWGHSDWVLGAYYLGDREDLQRQYTYLESDFFSDYDTDTGALFGQLETPLTEELTLVSGLRVERRRTDYSDSNGVAADPARTLWGGRLALEYQADDGPLYYASISRGYRANGVNARVLSSLEIYDDPRLDGLLTYDEEALVNYELGYKARLLEGRLQLRGALFWMDRRDQQVKGSLVIPREDGNSVAFIDHINNAASGFNRGLELELDWQASERLRLDASLGLLDARFDRYVNADGVDLADREQAHAPDYQAAIGARYAFTEAWYLRLDAEARDDFFFSDRHRARAESYELLHLRLGYTAERWEVALWGRNLTDEDYAQRGFGSFGNDPRKGYALEPYYSYGEPRTFGVSASYQF
jgi:outer membrane receptor protein involved in Fe transport